MSNRQLETESGTAPRRPGAKDLADLLQRIARQRDREAFSQLFQLLEKPAFKLSYYLTASRELAEDGVQQGFLQIWLKAGGFRGTGNAKAWMLRIIAGESLKALRRRRRDRYKDERAQHPADCPCAEAGPEERLGAQELRVALRQGLCELPETDRHLLALYHCGELTQGEIARQLRMPQRSVSHRLYQATSRLRRGLAGAGFAQGLEVLARLSFPELPGPDGSSPARLARMLERLETAPPPAAAGPSQGSIRPTARAALVCSLVAAAAWATLAIAGDRVWPRRSPAAEGNRAPLARPEWTAPSGPFRTLAHWDFNSPGLPRSLQPVQGSCRRLAGLGPDGSGCLELDDGAVLLLDVPISKLPVVVTWRQTLGLPRPNGLWAVSVSWTERGAGALISGIAPPQNTRPGEWISRRTVCAEDWIVEQSGSGRIFSVALARRSERAASLLFAVRGRHRLDDLLLREAGSNELPDLPALLSAVPWIEPGRRTGSVPLAGCVSHETGRTLEMAFSPAFHFKRLRAEP